MKRRLLTTVAALGVFGALTACTPQQIAEWSAWNDQDPAAAQAFANLPEIQQALANAGQRQQPQPQQQASAPSGGWSLNWDKVAACESGGNWSHGPVRNSAGTFSGGLMIGHQYWHGYGGYNAPYQAPKSVQIAWAESITGGSYAKADQAWQCVGGPARSGV